METKHIVTGLLITFSIITAVIVFTTKAEAFNCPTTIALLEDDFSERDKCLAKMTSHYIVMFEMDLLKSYKNDLTRNLNAHETELARHSSRYHGNFDNRINKLINLKRLRHLLNYSAPQIRLKNANEISCGSSSSSSSK